DLRERCEPFACGVRAHGPKKVVILEVLNFVVENQLLEQFADEVDLSSKVVLRFLELLGHFTPPIERYAFVEVERGLDVLAKAQVDDFEDSIGSDHKVSGANVSMKDT